MVFAANGASFTQGSKATVIDQAALSPLLQWRQWIDGRPLKSVDGAGRFLLDAGAIALLASLALTLPFKNGALALCLVGAVMARPPLHRIPGFFVGCTFVAVLVATGFLQNGDPEPGSMAITWLAVPLGAAVFVSESRRKVGVWALLWVTATITGLHLAQFLVGTTVDVKPLRLALFGDRFSRVGGLHEPVPAANLLTAAVLLAFMPLGSLGLGRRDSWHFRIISSVALATTLVRMAVLAVGAGFCVWLVAAGGAVRRWWWTAPLAMALAFLALGVMDPERLQRMLSFEDGRWIIWRVGSQVIMDFPLIGTGSDLGLEFLMRFPAEESAEFGLKYMNLHNTWLTLAATNGVLAPLLYAAWLGTMAWAFIRGCKLTRGPGLALITAAIVLGMFDHFAGRPAYHLGLYAALGLLLGMHQAGGVSEQNATATQSEEDR